MAGSRDEVLTTGMLGLSRCVLSFQSPGSLNTHTLNEEAGDPCIHLLYRPGHYDILYQAPQ